MLTNEKDKEEQAKIFAEAKCPLKPGDKARHKINTDLRIVVMAYSKTHWRDDMSRFGKFENPAVLICQSYNIHTHEHIDNVIYECIELEAEIDTVADP
jgi:hypothetical protein